MFYVGDDDGQGANQHQKGALPLPMTQGSCLFQLDRGGFPLYAIHHTLSIVRPSLQISYNLLSALDSGMEALVTGPSTNPQTLATALRDFQAKLAVPASTNTMIDELPKYIGSSTYPVCLSSVVVRQAHCLSRCDNTLIQFHKQSDCDANTEDACFLFVSAGIPVYGATDIRVKPHVSAWRGGHQARNWSTILVLTMHVIVRVM